MTMLSFKQGESNYDKKEACQRGCTWMIKFSHCLNFGYRECGIVFSVQTQNGCTRCTQEEKSVNFHAFSRRVSFPFTYGKAIFRESRRLKKSKFSPRMATTVTLAN